jgi:hypothetical protein
MSTEQEMTMAERDARELDQKLTTKYPKTDDPYDHDQDKLDEPFTCERCFGSILEDYTTEDERYDPVIEWEEVVMHLFCEGRRCNNCSDKVEAGR